jgi:hypothetical protein
MPDLVINDAQAFALAEALKEHAGSGAVIQITQQGDRSLVVGFGLATVEITTEGTRFDD